MSTANILMIDRLRMGTDGIGVTTLIGFYGCHLQCKYCINNQCHLLNPTSSVTSEDLYNKVKIDRLYFHATGGGLTFGGGEPLLNYQFIKEVMEFGAKEWHTTIETSLNVPIEKWFKLINYIDEYIVDVKDINPSIYKSYTGFDNDTVIYNLKELILLGFSDKVLIRLPKIPGYNTTDDVLRSRELIEEMGYKKFDHFNYKI